LNSWPDATVLAGVRTYLHRSWSLRGLLLAAAFFAGISFLAPAARASERWATLEAIHQLENPTNSTRVGPHGELGAYQFRRETWAMYTQTPFHWALDRQVSDQVAVLHYEWLKEHLARNGISPTPYHIALAWNCGIGAVLRARPPSAAVSYAQRAANLAATYNGAALADAR